MDKTYYKRESDLGVIIWFEEDGRRISFGETPGNRHYEEYLAWVAEGGEPEVIDLAVPEPTE